MPTPTLPEHRAGLRNSVTIKVALIGDESVGKTSLMVKYVNNEFKKNTEQTKGVNFMERNIHSGATDVKFSIYDLGGASEFENMLPLTTNDAVSVVLVFDLSNAKSLDHLLRWYNLARNINHTAIPIIVGTKFDKFIELPKNYQEKIHQTSLDLANKIGASLIFTSNSDSINVQKVFKILISKAFDLEIRIPEIVNVGEPLLLYNV